MPSTRSLFYTKIFFPSFSLSRSLVLILYSRSRKILLFSFFEVPTLLNMDTIWIQIRTMDLLYTCCRPPSPWISFGLVLRFGRGSRTVSYTNLQSKKSVKNESNKRRLFNVVFAHDVPAHLCVGPRSMGGVQPRDGGA
jgi:hypothetical protein